MSVSADAASHKMLRHGRAAGRSLPPGASLPWVKSIQRRRSRSPALACGALASLVQAIAAKDPETMRHSRRVRRYAEAIAEQLGVSRAFVREVGTAAVLHDVGKIGVPDELLHRAGPLSAAEHVDVLQHTVIGERILTPLMPRQTAVLAVVRWHHERVDGCGYPDGLRGSQIPLAARIVAVADAFDAMRSSRPYRAALRLGVATRELVQGVGRQFDARCVAALRRVVDRARRRVWPHGRPRRWDSRTLRRHCGAWRPVPRRLYGWDIAREPRAPPVAASRVSPEGQDAAGLDGGP
jgi:putative nucleotidyltransferase with HDIG domain